MTWLALDVIPVLHSDVIPALNRITRHGYVLIIIWALGAYPPPPGGYPGYPPAQPYYAAPAPMGGIPPHGHPMPPAPHGHAAPIVLG